MSSTTETPPEFQRIGPDLLLHSPSSLVVLLGAKPGNTRLIDVRSLKQNAEFELYDNFRRDLLYKEIDLHLQAGCNFISSTVVSSVITQFPIQEEELLMCPQCSSICFPSPIPRGLFEFHATGYCSGARNLLKCRGYRIHGGRMAFVLSEGSVEQSEEDDNSSNDNAVGMAYHGYTDDSPDTSLNSDYVSGSSQWSTASTSTQGGLQRVDQELKKIGPFLYLHVPTQVIIQSSSIKNNFKLYDPIRSPVRFKDEVFGSWKAAAFTRRWSEFYYAIPDPKRKNFAVVANCDTLSHLIRLVKLAICAGCKEVCFPWPSRRGQHLSRDSIVAAHMRKCRHAPNWPWTPHYGFETVQYNPHVYLVLASRDTDRLLGPPVGKAPVFTEERRGSIVGSAPGSTPASPVQLQSFPKFAHVKMTESHNDRSYTQKS